MRVDRLPLFRRRRIPTCSAKEDDFAITATRSRSDVSQLAQKYRDLNDSWASRDAREREMMNRGKRTVSKHLADLETEEDGEVRSLLLQIIGNQTLEGELLLKITANYCNYFLCILFRCYYYYYLLLCIVYVYYQSIQIDIFWRINP